MTSLWRFPQQFEVRPDTAEITQNLRQTAPFGAILALGFHDFHAIALKMVDVENGGAVAGSTGGEEQMRRTLSLVVVIGLMLSTTAFAANPGSGLRRGDKDGDGRCDVCGQSIGQRQCMGKSRQARGRGNQRMGQRIMNQQQAGAFQQK